jgi:hypothetical protein
LLAGAAALAALGALGALTPAPAAAQALAVQGNRFTVDGQARFLTFVTYFDALDVPNGQLETDFNNLRNAVHVDGIRIMPNWWEQPTRASSGRTIAANTVMGGSGEIREPYWSRLVYVLGRARAYGLVVDVSWTAETIGNISYPQYREALGEVTRRLRSPAYNHVLFDLQNESDLNGPQRIAISNDQARDLTAYVHSQDPGRIVTVSGGSNPDAARSRAEYAGEDVVAWHEPRISNWAASADSDVKRMRLNGKPAYLQEPPKHEDFNGGVGGGGFLQAAQAAKQAGAAAWCYHNSAGQQMNPAPHNPSGGLWPRIVDRGVDYNEIDEVVLANLAPWLNAVPWGIDVPPGPGQPPASLVTFYWDINYSGTAFGANASSDFVGWTWNDQISSLRVAPGHAVVLYQDWMFGGAAIRLTGDITDLRVYGVNDWASSFRIE